MSRFTFLLILAVSLAFAACDDGAGPDDTLRLENIPLAPLPAGTLWPLQTNRTGPIEWSVSDPAVASVTSAGVLWAREAGEVAVQARRGSDTARATVVVSPPAEGKIVFKGEGGIRAIRADGEGETLVAAHGEPCSFLGLDVSPAGEAIAATCSDETSIYWMQLDGTDLRKVTDHFASDVVFAAEDRLVYGSGSAVFMADLTSDITITIWSEEAPRPDGGRLVRVRRLATVDGAQVFFSGTTEGFPYDERLGVLQAVDSLYVAELHDIAGTRRAIAYDLARDPSSGLPGSSAQIMLFYRISVPSPAGLLLVTHSLGTFTVDPENPGAPSSPFAAPGGTYLAHHNPHGDRIVAVRTEFTEIDLGIVIIDLQSGQTTFLVERPGPFHDPTWSP